MQTYPLAIYDAFTDHLFGGSQAAIVMEAGRIDADKRLQIARELNLPATCFVTAHSANSVTARFQSTEREYLMCGHGTICLMTHMIDLGVFNWGGSDKIEVELVLPTTTAKVEITRSPENRAVVMLDINPPTFAQANIDPNELASLLGIDPTCFASELPIETAIGDFTHLVVPVNDLAHMNAITPDFAGIIDFCHRHDIETIACFTLQTEHPDHDIHARDFCPAVGVPESAAAGTTNAALTSYLVRHQLIKDKVQIKAEQGLQINRPSSITSTITMMGNAISRLQIGGIATKFLDGNITV